MNKLVVIRSVEDFKVGARIKRISSENNFNVAIVLYPIFDINQNQTFMNVRTIAVLGGDYLVDLETMVPDVLLSI